jgi:hypothetical protein
VSDWGYVTIAFTLVWGSLAAYAVVLARRVGQAREVARKLREAVESERRLAEQDGSICDAPPGR